MKFKSKSCLYECRFAQIQKTHKFHRLSLNYHYYHENVNHTSNEKIYVAYNTSNFCKKNCPEQ